MKTNNTFILSIAGLMILCLMVVLKGIDTSGSIVAIIVAFIGADSAKRASHGWAASYDKACDTKETIREIERS